jgi:hypothetical protein
MGVENTMTDLTLADRIEAAERGDRELDAEIYNAHPDGENRKAERLPLDRREGRFDDGWRTMWADREDKYCEPLKRYTTSLDSAMTLLPEGWEPTITARIGRRSEVYMESPDRTKRRDTGSFAATPALALCAAALRAKEQSHAD